MKHMKEYKVISAKSPRDAEEQLNLYAAQGWDVKTMTTFEKWTWRIVIILEK